MRSPSTWSSRTPCGRRPAASCRCMTTAGRAVRPGRTQDEAAAGAVAALDEEAGDLGAAHQGPLRRHAQLGVLAQQGHERGHVRSLPRVDVAAKEPALGGRVRGRRARGDPLPLQRRPRPLQRAVGAGEGGLEELGGLGGRPAEHVAQDEHGTLAARELLDRGQERELHALVQRVAGRRVGRRRRRGLGGLFGDRQHGPRPARPRLELVEAGVGGDAEEPGLDGRAALEARATAPGAQERLLDGVLGVCGRAEQAVAVQEQGRRNGSTSSWNACSSPARGVAAGIDMSFPWTPPAPEIHR